MSVRLPNIEPSGFHAGQYVGYANGPWRIARVPVKQKHVVIWRAYRQQQPWAQLEAPTLTKLSAKLTAWEAEHAEKNKTA